ncbi:trypsin-like peptidase domain-containing protein [Streptomyces sp. NPDC041068]|uniref:trypsin-like peptidase domain-containing protein n=1 Tax=Streptomyces sp. NPDC041068 TaxID=3155130 RepID=UPI0033C2382C
MAGRGPRARGTGDTGERSGPTVLDRALVRICDLAGRPRGTGFAADELGTVVTSHEAVDGLARIVLHAPGERTCVVPADAVVPLPGTDLALVRTEGLGLRPLPIAERDSVATGAYVRIAARGWREARVLGSSPVTYTATDRFHLVGAALELAIGTDGADALRLGGGAAGGPVVDASSGAVIAVLGTALLPQSLGPAPAGQAPFAHRPAGYAVPLRDAAAADPDGPLAELLARNGATVPAYGTDLNLAGALHLTATSTGSDGPCAEPREPVEPVERPDAAREFDAFTAGPARVLALVGDPGTGRTTELAALAARRARGAAPVPTLWLRGADLWATDASVADAVERALDRAGRILAASASASASGEAESGSSPSEAALEGRDLGDISAGRVARVVRRAGRPLLLLLDGPEEMPPVLAHRLAEWSGGTDQWLRDTGTRLVVACRSEYWEQAGAYFDAASLHGTDAAAGLPGCVRLGDLPEPQARRARARYAIPDAALTGADARHPLAMRLLCEVRAARPDAPPPGTPGREEIFAAYLDLLCLRVAVRLAAANGLRGNAVRRLAAKVSGQVHEAARRCLGPGQGELDRASFEAVFPWGALSVQRGGREFHRCTGWASAVLTEGLLVPAGAGYRFAHEELADWIQGMHLDVDGALATLVHRHRDASRVPAVPEQRRRRPATDTGRPLPVPRHRIGPVVQALLLLGRQRGAAELAARLGELMDALTDLAATGRPGAPDDGCGGAAGPGVRGRAVGEGCPEAEAAGGGGRSPGRGASDAAWASRGDPAAGEGCPEAVSVGCPEAVGGGGPGVEPGVSDAAWWASRLLGEVLLRLPDATPYLAVLEPLAERGEFGTAFWLRLPLGEAERFPLLRRLVAHDGPPGTGNRCLDAVAELLAADPAAVQPHLARWFTDERPLDSAPDATVASAAQALLHTHRHRAIDDLTEALVDCAHARADELLAALCEDEPSAICRAVDRWAHDERPGRRVAAAAYGLRTAPHTTTEADRELLRYAAFALLARPADDTLHGAALALLVRDPQTRSRHLPHALRRFAAGDPQLPASALAAALTTHPEPVLAAFRARLHDPGAGASDVLCGLADVTTPALARRVATLVHDLLEARPEAAEPAAAYIDRRLEHGPGVRAVLYPLVAGLLHSRPARVRAALAPVLAAPGTAASRALRGELLDVLLSQERDAAVLESVLRSVADAAEECGEARTRERVHRVGLLLVRTPEGASCFDRRLVELAGARPCFAALVAGWLESAPQEWAALVGPSARRTIESLAGGVRIPA